MDIEKIQNKHLIAYELVDITKPKYKQMIKLTALIREDQRIFLDVVSKTIMKNREPNESYERITTNTILRCLIDFLSEKLDLLALNDLKNESELLQEIKSKLHF